MKELKCTRRVGKKETLPSDANEETSSPWNMSISMDLPDPTQPWMYTPFGRGRIGKLASIPSL